MPRSSIWLWSLTLFLFPFANQSHSQNIGIYGMGYLSADKMYQDGTGIGLYFSDYFEDNFDLGTDIHYFQNSKSTEAGVSYCNGEPCRSSFPAQQHKNVDSTKFFPSTTTFYSWRISLEPSWNVLEDKAIELDAGIDLSIGQMGGKETFTANGEQMQRGAGETEYSISKETHASLGVTTNMIYNDFLWERTNLFFKFNPEFYFAKRDPDTITDASPFKTENFLTLQGKLGLSYSFND